MRCFRTRAIDFGIADAAIFRLRPHVRFLRKAICLDLSFTMISFDRLVDCDHEGGHFFGRVRAPFFLDHRELVQDAADVSDC